MTTTPNSPEPPPEQLTLDRPYDLDDRATRLRAELDRLNVEKLRALTEALDDVKAATFRLVDANRGLDDAVTEARDFGATWQQIADAAGITKSAAWERWAHRG